MANDNRRHLWETINNSNNFIEQSSNNSLQYMIFTLIFIKYFNNSIPKRKEDE
jgi:hypothetical protein